MGIEKRIAFYDPKMNPNPLSKNIDGMWITKSEPYTVVRVWQTDSERPRLAEEPKHIQAYSAFMARNFYVFKPTEK